jgi:bacterioferritin
MITADKKAEEEAIELYKKILRKASDEDDETTNTLFRHILADEEDHHDTFVSLLEEI